MFKWILCLNDNVNMFCRSVWSTHPFVLANRMPWSPQWFISWAWLQGILKNDDTLLCSYFLRESTIKSVDHNFQIQDEYSISGESVVVCEYSTLFSILIPKQKTWTSKWRDKFIFSTLYKCNLITTTQKSHIHSKI